MEFFHPMFTRNGARNLKEIKRGNQPKKHDAEENMEGLEGPDEAPPPKKPRQVRRTQNLTKSEHSGVTTNLSSSACQWTARARAYGPAV